MSTGDEASLNRSSSRLGGLFVMVATTLYARTGEWPWWFVHVVGNDVPCGFVALALFRRRELELELGLRLPVVSPTPAAATRPMEQLGLAPAPGAKKSTRGAA